MKPPTSQELYKDQGGVWRHWPLCESLHMWLWLGRLMAHRLQASPSLCFHKYSGMKDNEKNIVFVKQMLPSHYSNSKTRQRPSKLGDIASRCWYTLPVDLSASIIYSLLQSHPVVFQGYRRPLEQPSQSVVFGLELLNFSATSVRKETSVLYLIFLKSLFNHWMC